MSVPVPRGRPGHFSKWPFGSFEKFGGSVFRPLLLLGLLGLSGAASAQVAVDAAYDRFRASIVGNVADLRFSSTGTVLASSGAPLTATGSGGAGYITRGAALATQHGPVAFTASQRFSAGALARGAAALALNPVVGIGLAVAAPYIYDWYTDAGIVIDSATGVPMEYPNTAGCQQYPQKANFTSCGGYAPATADLPVNAYFPAGHVFTNNGTAASSGCYATDQCTGGGGYTWKLYLGARGTLDPSMAVPATESSIVSQLSSKTRTDSEIERILAEGIKYPEFVPDVADTPQVLNPQPSPSKSSSSTTSDPATGTKTETRSCSMIGSPSSSGNQMTFSEICTTSTTTTPLTGSPTTVTGTSTTGIGVTVGSGQPSEAEPFEMPCGVDGASPCGVKVDETDVPATVTIADPFPQIEADQTTRRDAIKAADGSAWESVRDFFFLPPAASCVPFDMPQVMGMAVPPLDPCPVVGGMQQVIGVLWALGAFWLMFGWVREVV